MRAVRVAPILAGLAGLLGFWAELAPQRAGFRDTDDPAQGLLFLAAQPTAWAFVGVPFLVLSIALVVTVLSVRGRLATTDAADMTAIDAVSVVGLFAALMAFGFGVVRMGAGPVQYIQGLDQAWGEAAYLVTQIAGVQLLEPAGFLLLVLWIVGVAWIGFRGRVVPRILTILAIFPAFRLVGILGPFGLGLDELWIFTIAAIPAAYIWLFLLGAWPARAQPRLGAVAQK
jgi:hypothetical protein